MMATRKPPRSRRAAQASVRLSKALDEAGGRVAQSEVERSQSLEREAALVRARVGDPTELMPYAPTPSINPPRPRTQRAGYDRESQTMTVQFREGAVYEYYDVSPNEWRNFRRVKSPGKAINRTFNAKSYVRRFELEQ